MDLVGRVHERAAITAAVAALRTRRGGIVALEGEAGIGKSRLLAHLAAAADGCIVLEARASEFEADLPYALFTEALDLAAVDERRLAGTDRPALALVVPSLAGSEAAVSDRHRTHRALRDLLERLAASRPLVLALDDVHWADPASVDALAALVRRPLAAPVLLAVAAREGQMPAALAAALGGALREERVVALRLDPLSEGEAAELVGAAAAALYSLTGGNPFYLEQLARAPGAGAAGLSLDVPAAVAAALGGELAALTPDARRLLDAAAVAGDPFELELADEVAELSQAGALAALDELLARALVRPTAASRRFAFRHPVVRHAVYLAAPAGWRLGAHARAADVLERRGAGAVQRAHHVQYAARAGDEQALALLAGAAGELHASAPGTAARFHAAALRLLGNDRTRRIALQSQLADALAASGDTAGARETLLHALRDAHPAERLPALWMLGRARRSLGQPAPALTDLERGAALAAGTGRERIVLILTLESVGVLVALGRLADAIAAGEEGLELALLANLRHMRLWAHSALSSARLAAGDVGGALDHAAEAVAAASQPDFHAAGQPGWCLGAALTAAGEPNRAVDALLGATVLPADRPPFASDLVEAQLARGDVGGADAALVAGDTPWAALARSAVRLAQDRPDEALMAARAAATPAARAPLLTARARLAEGRALAALGRRAEAVEALSAAEAALDGFGALRRRDEAVRELRRLGRREREIARLVAGGRTNREIAEQLVLSTRTIEAHLRNIYAKLGVRSRVELAAALRTT